VKSHVITNAKGEFKLTDRFNAGLQEFPVYVEDIDGEKNGLFQMEKLMVNFKNAVHSGKPKGWYKGEYTVNVNVELTEIEKETDE
jgi:putative lipoprotein (rSAM/lipoprotein system)